MGTRLVILNWVSIKWFPKKSCSGRDLNPHAFRHTPLKRTCLPFHHPSPECSMQREMSRRRRFLASLFLLFTRAHAPISIVAATSVKLTRSAITFRDDVDLGRGKS